MDYYETFLFEWGRAIFLIKTRKYKNNSRVCVCVSVNKELNTS
jgi:hypothetical protein